MANAHCCCNYIGNLKLEGMEVKNDEVIESAILHSYKSLCLGEQV